MRGLLLSRHRLPQSTETPSDSPTLLFFSFSSAISLPNSAGVMRRHASLKSGVCLQPRLGDYFAAVFEDKMNIAGMVCAGVVLLAGSAAAQEESKAIQKTTITLGTATPGGGFPLYGDAFADVINA